MEAGGEREDALWARKMIREVTIELVGSAPEGEGDGDGTGSLGPWTF